MRHGGERNAQYQNGWKSGQISLGKAMAGMGFIMQELPGGDIVLKPAVVVPMNERLLDPVVLCGTGGCREWRRNNPAKATDLTAPCF